MLLLISCTDNSQKGTSSQSSTEPIETESEEVVTNTEPILTFPSDPQEQWNFMVQAVTNGNLDQLKFGINNGFPVNRHEIENDSSPTLLHLAFRYNQLAIFDYLMSQGTDINITSGDATYGYYPAFVKLGTFSNTNFLAHVINNYSNEITNFNDSYEAIEYNAIRFGNLDALNYLYNTLEYKPSKYSLIWSIDSYNTNTLEFMYTNGITNINEQISNLCFNSYKKSGYTTLKEFLPKIYETNEFDNATPKRIEDTVLWLTQKYQLLDANP